jgi:hypothetical protein
MLSKVRSYLSSHGLKATLGYLVARAGFVITPPETASETRVRLSNAICRHLDYKVISGVFTGMTLLKDSTWGRGDRGGQLLGLYEQEVQTCIHSNCSHYGTLIDVGAADGYYAVGCLFAGLFDRCIAFEANDSSRRSIRELALVNGVVDRLALNGICNQESLLSLPLEVRRDSFLLVDIEGGEYELLSDAVIAAFQGSFFVIELHPFACADGEAATVKLCQRFEATHVVERVGQGARNPNQFHALMHLHDHERWLLASENRGQWMEWLIAHPRVAHHA